MHKRIFYINFVRFILLVLLQVLILNNIELFGYINPYAYVLFILLLPFETPRWLLLILAFILGFCIDIFMNTIGMNIAATVLMAFARPGIVNIMTSERDFEANLKPGIRDFGFKWFFVYSGSLVLIHHLALFFLEAFKFTHFWNTISRALLSSVFTLFIIIILQYLFYKKKIN